DFMFLPLWITFQSLSLVPRFCILQTRSGCEYEESTGEKSGFLKYGFIEPDLKTLSWASLKADATKQSWDADRQGERMKERGGEKERKPKGRRDGEKGGKREKKKKKKQQKKTPGSPVWRKKNKKTNRGDSKQQRAT
uniref:Uncharacterized protein n=1 Tax=Maylandia zebra TaxID=106582 RepID=A0A3P9D739_9CICH